MNNAAVAVLLFARQKQSAARRRRQRRLQSIILARSIAGMAIALGIPVLRALSHYARRLRLTAVAAQHLLWQITHLHVGSGYMALGGIPRPWGGLMTIDNALQKMMHQRQHPKKLFRVRYYNDEV